MDSFEDKLQQLREAFKEGRTRSAEFRAAQLQGLSHFLRDNKQQLQEALAQDLHKSAFEAEVSEIAISQAEVDLALRNLRSWMKDEKVSKNLATQLDSAFIRKEPFGLVLIIVPWNYPINLTLVPLVGAIAAGNCVVLKPSETSKATEKILAEVLPRYLDQSCFTVVLGGPQETGQLLEHKFDYIFFTAPTVLVDVQETEPVMQEEIFGPILPLVTVRSLDEAIEFMNRREKPLALYAFSKRSQVIKQVLARTSSGGFCGNDGFMHMTLSSLPFGGVGTSGMGRYHGKFSFDTFSNQRACLLRSPRMEKINDLRYPPYSSRNLRVLLVAMEERCCSCTLL